MRLRLGLRMLRWQGAVLIFDEAHNVEARRPPLRHASPASLLAQRLGATAACFGAWSSMDIFCEVDGASHCMNRIFWVGTHSVI